MQRTGSEVVLEIAKKAALYHGLGKALLSNGRGIGKCMIDNK